MADGDEWAGLDPGDEWPTTGIPELDERIGRLALACVDAEASMARLVDQTSLATVRVMAILREKREAGLGPTLTRMEALDMVDECMAGQAECIRRATEDHIARVAAAVSSWGA